MSNADPNHDCYKMWILKSCKYYPMSAIGSPATMRLEEAREHCMSDTRSVERMKNNLAQGEFVQKPVLELDGNYWRYQMANDTFTQITEERFLVIRDIFQEADDVEARQKLPPRETWSGNW